MSYILMNKDNGAIAVPNPSPLSPGGMPEGIEVVELADVDLDFAIEQAFREETPQTLDATRTETATPEDLAEVELFRGLEPQELAALASRCQLIYAIPGHVLTAATKLNTKVYFVLEGQLRLYPPTSDKRPTALIDVGHSTGLHSALVMNPSKHSVIAVEVSQILAVDATLLEEFAKRSHAFACNYNALLASYLRGNNCLYVGVRSRGSAGRASYIDELTLLHNQHWLDTMLPRLASRYRLNNRPIAMVAFAVDKHEQIVKEHGIGIGLRVLEAIGHWMFDQTRPTDILAIDKNRHFFAFLPECDLTAASQLTDRLKAQIKITPLSLAGKAPITITLSFGIAMLEQTATEGELLNTIEALIRQSIMQGGDRLSDTLEQKPDPDAVTEPIPPA